MMAIKTARLDTSIDRFSSGTVALFAINGSEAMMIAVAEGARLRAEHPRTPLLFLGPGGAAHASAALRAGATVFVATPADASELLQAADRCALQGRPGPFEGENILEVCPGIALDVRAHCLWVDGEEKALSHTKFELLAYLLENAGRAVGPEELTRARILTRSQAARLKGIIAELRSVIGRAKGTIRTVPGYGYRFAPVCSAPPAGPTKAP